MRSRENAEKTKRGPPRMYPNLFGCGMDEASYENIRKKKGR
jgi:hypothetical protein